MMSSLNLSAPINQLGYGIVGTNLLRSLAKSVRVALWPLGEIESPNVDDHETIRSSLSNSDEFDSFAPSLRVWHPFEMSHRVGRGVGAGYTFFELDRLTPREICHLNSLDVLFTASAWSKRVLADAGVDSPRIIVAPPGIDRSIFTQSFCQFNEGPTVFFCCGKWEYRKGHGEVLDSFNRAFEPSDNVKLVMNCNNPCRSAQIRSAEDSKRYNDEWVRAYMTSKMGSAEKIFCIPDRYSSQASVAALMAQADCGVFPSRAEGWGLESAEMLAMGKHVIITDYGAHTEYATPDNSLLIKTAALEDAWDGHWFDSSAAHWNGSPGRWAALGEDQVDQLVAHMRGVHARKQSGRLEFNAAGFESMKKFSWENTAKSILSALE